MTIRPIRQPRCGGQGNSATEVRAKRNGDNSDITSKRIDSEEVTWAAQAIARTE